MRLALENSLRTIWDWFITIRGLLVIAWTFGKPSRAKRHRDKYSGMHASFLFLPKGLKRVRVFFEQDRRGFGERAFVSMWFEVFKLASPSNVLEIGIYRGQTLAIWTQIAKELDLSVNATGLGPMDSSADGVSKYPEIDYVQDIEASFHELGLDLPNLIRAKSQEGPVIDELEKIRWDLIYVDGSHDYADVISDLNFARRNMKSNNLAITVVDDAGYFFGYRPFRYSFGGHPGPAQAAKEVLGEFRHTVVGHNVVFFGRGYLTNPLA